MDISERIENLKPYFVGFNVMAQDDASYVLMRFPGNWALPDENTIKDVYLTEIAPRQEGVYFLTELKNGTEKLFDCVEFVIKYNKNIEERKYLLQAKIKELTKLFASEDLEALKTLTFAMEPVSKDADETTKKPKIGKPKKAPAKTKEQEVEEILSEAASETISEEVPVEKKNEEPEGDDNGLMALAKGLTGE